MPTIPQIRASIVLIVQAHSTPDPADRATIEDDVRAFLDETFPLAESGFSVDARMSLVDAGVIDSTGVLELVEFLEARYGIRIDEIELTPENLDSIERIGQFVERKLPQPHEV